MGDDVWTREEATDSYRRYAPVAVVAALTALAAAVRLYGLGQAPILDGEAITGMVARGLAETGTDTLPSGRTYGRGILLTYLARYSTALVGDGPVGLRLPVALFATATVPLVYAIGARTFGRRVGYAAAALQAFSLVTVAWSRTARFYALLQCFVVLAVYCYLRIDELVDPLSDVRIPTDARLRVGVYAAGFALAVAAASYTHRQWLVVPLVVGLALLVPSADEPNRLVYAKLVVWAVVALNVTTLVLAQQLLVPPSLFDFVPGAGVVQSVAIWEHPISGRSVPHFFFSYYPLLTVAALVGIGVALWERTEHTALVLVWLFAPLVLFAYLGENFRFIWRPRYLLVFTPAFLLLAARGVVAATDWAATRFDDTALYRNAALASVVVLLVATPVAQDVRATADPHTLSQLEEPQPDYQRALERVGDARQPGDIIITNRPKKVHYWTGDVDYRGNGHTLQWSGTNNSYHTGAPALETNAEMRDVIESHERVWVVYNPFMPLSADDWIAENLTRYAVVESPFETRFPHGLYDQFEDAEGRMDDERVYVYTKGIEPPGNATGN
ncbi:glycosyltransferase family 39 protein [Halosimplex halophilum]|uniref:glycosyltransferase family 39 protein n=1 Tax=Halosimplex halophilum TaxID=2559572 RepID=UPI00107F5F09|nr:glycosyltransferase family 39 protein [Halosimplex halophilum]